MTDKLSTLGTLLVGYGAGMTVASFIVPGYLSLLWNALAALIVGSLIAVVTSGKKKGPVLLTICGLILAGIPLATLYLSRLKP